MPAHANYGRGHAANARTAEEKANDVIGNLDNDNFIKRPSDAGWVFYFCCFCWLADFFEIQRGPDGATEALTIPDLTNEEPGTIAAYFRGEGRFFRYADLIWKINYFDREKQRYEKATKFSAVVGGFIITALSSIETAFLAEGEGDVSTDSALFAISATTLAITLAIGFIAMVCNIQKDRYGEAHDRLNAYKEHHPGHTGAMAALAP